MNHIVNYSNSTVSFQPSSTADHVLRALAAYDLKQEHEQGKYRCNSPLRPGSNSHAFTLILHDSEHGAYFDHVSEDSGTLYDLATKLGIDIPTPTRQSIPTTKRVYRGLGDYAQAHGINADVFAAAGWSETTYQNRPALAFTTQTGTRYRFLDGDKPTYKSPVGYERCWYGLQRAVQLAQETGQPLIICNGEASTVVGQHFGLAACAVTGGEKKELPAQLLDELKLVYSGPVMIAFDCLDKGAEAAPLLAAQLTRAGWVARAVDLGLGKGGDLADFCRLHTTQAVTALAKLPTLACGSAPTASSPTQQWQWIHADQLDNLPPIRWLIPNEIPEQALVVLFGQSGAGKSFIALDYSLRIAQEQAVFYIAAEGHSGYANRKIAWCKYHQLPSGKLYFPADNAVVALLDPKVVQDFIASILPYQPKLIVFDTLAWCMTGGDENSTTDMQRVITYCRQIQTATGATVLLVHHTGKNGGSERGSSALRGGADMMIEVTSDDDLITLSCSKSKETEGFEDRHLACVTMATRPGETSCVWIPTERAAHRRTDKLTRFQREVLDMLAMPLFSEVGARFTQLADTLPNASRSGLYKTLNRLMAAAYICQGNKGEPFKITPAGMLALSTNADNSPSRESTVSTPSLPSVLETPSPLSTLSTPPRGGGQTRHELDTAPAELPDRPASVPPAAVAVPTLDEAARTTLKTMAEYAAQHNPLAFAAVGQVFPHLEPTHLPTLHQLCEQGYLERRNTAELAYRPSAAGWKALGLCVKRVDLSSY